jgi:hypothetical protein
MQISYGCLQRISIYHHVSIKDIPPEVLEKGLGYLLPSAKKDLVAACRVCSAWYPIASRLLMIVLDIKEEEGCGQFICALHLQSVVFGLESFFIRRLVLRFSICKEDILLLTSFAAPTLSSLAIVFEIGDEPHACYEALGVFFEECAGIQTLKLMYFDFGDNPDHITQTVKDGFSRLIGLGCRGCFGSIPMFVENTPIPNLQTLDYTSQNRVGGEEENVSAFASRYCTLITVNIVANFESPSSLLKFVECCPYIESFTFKEIGVAFGLPHLDNGNSLIMSQSVVKAISSLPRLKELVLGCLIPNDSIPFLMKCKRLEHLRLLKGYVDISALLPVIGGQLVSLYTLYPNKGILQYCPNLRSLETLYEHANVEVCQEFRDAPKNELKRLSSYKISGYPVRLGTDWEGYPKSRWL